MNTDETRMDQGLMQTQITHSEAETMEFASRFAQGLKGGEVLALQGDLGSGKTAFVKGLARGLGISAAVASPTFNLVHRYRGGRLPLIHYDLYRLKKISEIEALDLETEMESPGQKPRRTAGAPQPVIAIEWPELVKPILPRNRTLWIKLQDSPEGPSSSRILVTSIP